MIDPWAGKDGVMMDLAEKAAVIDRICRMERYFDCVQEAAKDGAA